MSYATDRGKEIGEIKEIKAELVIINKRFDDVNKRIDLIKTFFF